MPPTSKCELDVNGVLPAALPTVPTAAAGMGSLDPALWERAAADFARHYHAMRGLNPSDWRALWFTYAALRAGEVMPERWRAVAALLEHRMADPLQARSRPLFQLWEEVLVRPEPSRQAGILALDDTGQQLRSASPLAPLFGPGEREAAHAIFGQRLRRPWPAARPEIAVDEVPAGVIPSGA